MDKKRARSLDNSENWLPPSSNFFNYSDGILESSIRVLSLFLACLSLFYAKQVREMAQEEENDEKTRKSI